MKKKKERGKRTVWDVIHTLIIIVLVLMIPILGFEVYKYKTALDEYNSIPEMSDVPATANLEVLDVSPELWPDDSLFLEKARADYREGDLHLIVPRMGVDDDVMDGTDKAQLKHGPGLYTVAQMPGKDRNSNTSIAGHRAGYSRYGNIFKQIHTVGERDLLYLTDKERIYVYLYHDTLVTDPSDVSVLYLKGFPCLTLTSCHPLGGNTQRIIVTGKLVAIYPKEDGFDFKMSAGDEEMRYYDQQ